MVQESHLFATEMSSRELPGLRLDSISIIMVLRGGVLWDLKKHIYGSQKNGSILSIFIIRKVKIGHFKDPTFSKLFTMNTRQYE